MMLTSIYYYVSFTLSEYLPMFDTLVVAQFPPGVNGLREKRKYHWSALCVSAYARVEE